MSVKGRWFGAEDSYIACSFLSVFFAWRKSSLVMSANTYSLWCLKFFFWKGTKEMTEWLGVLATLAEDLALVPRTHIKWLPTVCDSSSLGSTVLFWPQGLLHCCGAPKHLLHTDEYIFKVFEENTMIFETFKIHMKFSVENNNILT